MKNQENIVKKIEINRIKMFSLKIQESQQKKVINKSDKSEVFKRYRKKGMAGSVMKQGKWICFPGDYEIMLAEKVQVRRYQRDFPIAPFWRVDSPWHNVRFFKEFHLDKPTILHFSWEGRISVFLKRPTLHLDDYYSYDFTGVLELPAGDHYMEIWVYNSDGLPCLKIDRDALITDESFEVGCEQIDMYNAGVCDCGDMTPNTYVLPTREILPKAKFEKDGDVVYDFGRMVFAFANVKGEGNYRLYFGETLAEAMNDVSRITLTADRPYFGKTAEEAREYYCEQTEKFTLKKGETHRSEVSKAFRYLRVCGGEHTVRFEEEYDPTFTPVCFETKENRLQKIFDVSLYTFTMCAREFYLDGAKRDRWLWGGDAYQAGKAEYYYQYNTERIKRSIVALFGKAPVRRYVNHIMDYTFYTILMTWEYYEHTGDRDFLEYIEPILSEHVRFCMTRLSKDGFICSIPHKGKFVDWIFVDWGDLPDKNGEVSSEQILFWAALKAAAKIYEVLKIDNQALLAFAEDLRRKTDEVFWSEEKGAYVFARNNGVIDTTVTCHANVFAILYGFATNGQKESIIGGLKKDKITLSITPFMIEFVLASLFEAGEYENAAARLEKYWGGMIDAGATTFWETYVEGEQEETATDMYARPFGRSKCHIWGAGPLYLIPRYYFGITGENLGESILVEPHLELIKGRTLTVSTKRGELTVSHDGKGVRILSTELDGRLVINKKEYSIKKGKEIYIEIE